MTASVKIVSNKLRVYIKDLLHLSIDLSELVGIQSYTYNNDRWHIDFITKTAKIECWYTSKELWESILKGLDQINLV